MAKKIMIIKPIEFIPVYLKFKDHFFQNGDNWPKVLREKAQAIINEVSESNIRKSFAEMQIIFDAEKDQLDPESQEIIENFLLACNHCTKMVDV